MLSEKILAIANSDHNKSVPSLHICKSINVQTVDNEESLCSYFSDLDDIFSGAPATMR